MTETTGRLAAASNSSRSRVTPGFIKAIALEPHCWQTSGRTVPQRPHTRVPSSRWDTAASQFVQRCSERHARHASSRARPTVLITHTTRVDESRSDAISCELTSDRFHGSSSVRSTTLMNGQPATESETEAPVTLSPAHSNAAAVGMGEISTHAAPACAARSIATSRACQVGDRSSCSASSCSSSTTMLCRPGHGAHTALRPPTTTSTPAAACAHSSGSNATRSPTLRSRLAIARAANGVGCTTMHGPQRTISATSGSGSTNGGTRRTPLPTGSRLVTERRVGGRPVTIVAGDAATRNGRTRGAPHRTAAQRAKSMTSAGGPTDENLAISTNDDAGRSTSGDPSATTHPPMRRPCSTTRTSEPAATRSRRLAGTR